MLMVPSVVWSIDPRLEACALLTEKLPEYIPLEIKTEIVKSAQKIIALDHSSLRTHEQVHIEVGELFDLLRKYLDKLEINEIRKLMNQWAKRHIEKSKYFPGFGNYPGEPKTFQELEA